MWTEPGLATTPEHFLGVNGVVELFVMPSKQVLLLNTQSKHSLCSSLL